MPVNASKLLYVIAIGLLVVGVVGFGFSAFYPQPAYPEYPSTLTTPTKVDGTLTDEQQQIQRQFDADAKIAQDKIENYNRNISIGLIIASLIILGISIMGVGKIDIIGDGLTLGGVFTLFYGLGRAMAGGDDKVRFLAAVVGLVVILGLTYWKFIKPNQTAPVA